MQSLHRQASDQMNVKLEESKDQIEQLEAENMELKERMKE